MTKTPKKNAVGDVTVMEKPDTSTEITPHEIVNAPARLTPEDQAKLEVKKFDLPRAWIAQKKADYKDLKISGAEDKDGYKKVEAAWQEVRGKRIATEKKREEIKGGYLVIGRAIDAEAKDLISLLREIEDPLNNALVEIDDLKKQAAAELERQAQLKLQNRVSELLENGMQFTGSYYSIGETISMDVVTLKSMKDDEFTFLLDKVKTTNRDILEAKRKKAQDDQDERDRIENQRKENERIAEENRLAQAAIDEQKRKLAATLLKMRTQQLTSLGMSFVYANKTFEFRIDGDRAFMGLDYVETAADEAFDAELAKLTVDISKLKEKAQKAADDRKKTQDELDELNRKAQEKKNRTLAREMEILSAFGVKKEGEKYVVRSKVPGSQAAMSILKTTVEDLDENAWANAMNESKKVFKKFQAENLKDGVRYENEQEAKRRAAMTDAEQISDIMGRMAQIALVSPQLTTDAAKEIWKKFDTGFGVLLVEAEDAINKL
jgi:hypothetical protein